MRATFHQNEVGITPKKKEVLVNSLGKYNLPGIEIHAQLE